jgi:nitroreductase
MNSIENLKWRYACKKFDETKQLTQDQINMLCEAFNLTATSYGLQPIKMVVVTNKSILKELVPHSYNQQQIGQASALLVLCAQNTIDKQFIIDHFELVKKVRKTPDDTLAPFRESLIKNFESKSEEEIKIWALKQAYIAMGNLLTVCAAEKIDACPMEGFIPKEYNSILKLEEKGLNSVLVIPVGYRDDSDLFNQMEKVRKPLDEVIHRID